MKTADLEIVFLFLLVFGKVSESQSDLPDACKHADVIPFDHIRMYAYERHTDELPLCDRNIINETKWYKATDDMVTNATRPDTCGTTNGLWLSGIIPTSKTSIGKEIIESVCVPNFISDCHRRYSIKIMNCGSFRVYKLAKPVSCPQAYCFGYGVKDTPPSEKTLSPKVEHEFTRKQGRKWDYQVSNFKCVFPFLRNTDTNKPFLYQIYWIINGITVYVTEAVKKEEFRQTFLNENNGINKMGIKIACSVRLKFHPRGLSGPISDKSDEFFAGIKLTRQSIHIQKGQKGQIELTLTVPFPCVYKKNAVHLKEIADYACPLDIELKIPTGQRGVCESRLGGDSKCGIPLNAKNWNVTYAMNITHQPTGKYKLSLAEAEKTVYLKTYEYEIGKAWSNMLLPPVKVYIEESKDGWQGSSCTAHSDPHMKTFDDITYDNQNNGTFIMYRNIFAGNVMEVQTEVTSCNYNTHIFCICGIAVRAAGDVFVINRCPHKRKVFTFRSCIDNILDVRKVDELNYKIYMPTGTYVQTRLQTYSGVNVMEVDIFPSEVDVGQSEGLCSKLKSGKLIKRDGTDVPVSLHPDDFSMDWRVEDKDNLLEMPDGNIQQLKPLPESNIVCICDDKKSDAENPNGLLTEADCSKDRSIICDIVQTKPYQKNTCHAKRMRRSLQTRLSFIPDNFVHHHIRQKRDVFQEANVFWTKDKAKEFCLKYMNESAGYKACLGVPNITPKNAIADCVADIQLTNSTSWATASREGLKALCFKELSQNNTFQESIEEKHGVSLVESILSVTCPSECNERGICKNGTCICNEDYGAADCSIKLSDPPIVNGVNLDTGGLCDKTHCSQAFVEGDLFLDRTTLTCKMQRFDISYEGKKVFLKMDKVEANHNSISDVICPFPKLRKKRSTSKSFISGYKISISNDGNVFSPSHLLYILDSTCQDTLNMSGNIKFALKDGYCFINGRCIVDGTQDGSNICNVCRYKSNLFNWSKHTTNSICEERSSKLWIAGVVTGCIAILFCLVIAFFFYKKKQRMVRTMSPPSYK